MTYGINWWGGTSWHGNCPLSECSTACIDSVLYQFGGHPNGCDHAPALAWVSPWDGVVRVTGNAHKLDPNGGDGVDVDILKNDRLLWSRTIAFDDAVGHDFDLTVPAKTGDHLYFRIHQRLTTDYDSTYFNPTITLERVRRH